MTSEKHISVMQEECIEGFKESKLRVFFDGTLGAGGHAKALLEAHPEIELYIACDQDTTAIELAKERLAPWKDKVIFVHGNFCDLDHHLKERNIKTVDGFFLTWGSPLCN